MKILRSLIVVVLACGPGVLWPTGARADAPAVRQLRIDPSTTKVLVGRARLSVDPLGRDADGGGLTGGYKVEVSPVPVGSESGRLSVKVSAEDLQRLASGQPVQFTGQAVSTAGNSSEVRGTATPSGQTGDGALRVHIASKKGKLVFNTTYHLVR